MFTLLRACQFELFFGLKPQVSIPSGSLYTSPSMSGPWFSLRCGAFSLSMVSQHWVHSLGCQFCGMWMFSVRLYPRVVVIWGFARVSVYSQVSVVPVSGEVLVRVWRVLYLVL